MTSPPRSQPGNAGHTEAEGHAASLRQMADHEYVDFGELRAAADFIDRTQCGVQAWDFFTDHKDDVPTDSGFMQTAWDYVTSIPTPVWLGLAGVGLALDD